MQSVSEHWVTQAQKGSPEAASAIYENFHQRIFRYMVYRIGDEQAAEDLTGDVFFKMLRALPGFQVRSAGFTSWLFQIARNMAIDHARKTTAHPSAQLTENQLAGENTLVDVEQRLTSQRLKTVLQQLSEEQRDVIILRFVEDLPIAETAAVLHRSPDSIKGLQRRALQNLRQLLEGEEGEDYDERS